jgi:Flp pilus assembly protein TadD
MAMWIAPGSGIAQDLRITIPGRSQLTPVQRLNRDGVDAVLKHRYEKAEGLFYKAYLFDPADPFTLNNLGYVSELHGQLDRAEKFYKLAADGGCEAIIERSDEKQLAGKPMMYALGTSKNAPMRVNRLNVLGIEMLSQDRAFEALSILREALALDPKNPFTLNNLGVAEEATGNFEEALKNYGQVAASRASEQAVVTPKRSWRGKPVGELAADSAQNLRKRMAKLDPARARADMLAMEGVFAANRNDWSAARKDFLEAYPLDPQSAFALNNRGYVAERDGDPEAAKFFYAAAKRAENAGQRVGSATQSLAKGQQLSAVADDSSRKVDDQLQAYGQERRRQKGPVELRRRDGATAPAATPVAPDAPTPEAQPPAAEPAAPPPALNQTNPAVPSPVPQPPQ